MSRRPVEEEFRKLIELKIATIKDDKYVYASEFEESVDHIKRNPPGKFHQLRLARKVHRDIISALIQSALLVRKKRDIENMIISYVCLLTHTKRLKIEIPKDDLPDVVYATYYLNDNEPEVWSEEEIENV